MLEQLVEYIVENINTLCILSVLMVILYRQMRIMIVSNQIVYKLDEFIEKDIQAHALHSKEYTLSITLLKQSISAIEKRLNRTVKEITNDMDNTARQINVITNNLYESDEKIKKYMANMCADLDRDFKEINIKLMVHDKLIRK